MSHTYEFFAGMSCDGCKNAITRVLSKLAGVESLDVDVSAQKLVVKGTASREAIEEKLGKWSKAAGKEVRFVKEL